VDAFFNCKAYSLSAGLYEAQSFYGVPGLCRSLEPLDGWGLSRKFWGSLRNQRGLNGSHKRNSLLFSTAHRLRFEKPMRIGARGLAAHARVAPLHRFISQPGQEAESDESQ
jgi:hypothetical protein